MSEKTFEMTMLFDFYGELLTDKQREYFDLYYNNDLTLSEIAEAEGITRQGVRDMLVRAEGSLLETERRIGLVKKFAEDGLVLNEIAAIAGDIAGKTTDPEIRTLTEGIIQGLEKLRF